MLVSGGGGTSRYVQYSTYTAKIQEISFLLSSKQIYPKTLYTCAFVLFPGFPSVSICELRSLVCFKIGISRKSKLCLVCCCHAKSAIIWTSVVSNWLKKNVDLQNYLIRINLVDIFLLSDHARISYG